MALATLTTKGQVTIPKKIRESLKLHTGDKIEIIVTANREAIIRPVSKKVDDIFGKLHKPGRKAVDLEAIDDAIKSFMNSKADTLVSIREVPSHYNPHWVFGTDPHRIDYSSVFAVVYLFDSYQLSFLLVAYLRVFHMFGFA